jgi:hypothetical protein
VLFRSPIGSMRCSNTATSPVQPTDLREIVNSICNFVWLCAISTASILCDVAVLLHRRPCRRTSRSTKKDDPPAAGAVAQAERSARPGPGRTNSVGAGPTLPKPSHCHAKLPPVTVQYDVAVLLHRPPCQRTSRSTKKDDPPAAGAIAQAEHSARSGLGHTNSPRPSLIPPKPSHCHAKLPLITLNAM